MYKPNNKIKNVNIDYRLMEFRETDKEHPAKFGVTAVSLHKVEELLAMAAENIVPDGNYSDFECCVWESMRKVLYAESLID